MADQVLAPNPTPPVATIGPAYTTSGFWLTLASILVSMLVCFHVLNNDPHADLVNFLGRSMEGTAILLPQVFVLGRFLKQRTVEHQAQHEQIIEQQRINSQEQTQKLIDEQVAKQIALLMQNPPKVMCETCKKRKNEPKRKNSG